MFLKGKSHSLSAKDTKRTTQIRRSERILAPYKCPDAMENMLMVSPRLRTNFLLLAPCKPGHQPWVKNMASSQSDSHFMTPSKPLLINKMNKKQYGDVGRSQWKQQCKHVPKGHVVSVITGSDSFTCSPCLLPEPRKSDMNPKIPLPLRFFLSCANK